jgi:D-serine deaminase-like pyridoxal phosphate-dependent protein
MDQTGGIAPIVDAAAFQRNKEFLQNFLRDPEVRTRAISKRYHLEMMYSFAAAARAGTP